jgi:hypothetical protein
MRHIYFNSLLLYQKILIAAFLLSGTNLFGQIGIQTNTPDVSAALDIVSSDKGLLIPRITLTNDLTNQSPVSSPAEGLLIFNSGANQSEGFYFWDSSEWLPIGTANDFWKLTGNSGTSDITNFIGTTDTEDFVVRTNDTELMRFTSGGATLVGLTSPYFSTQLVTLQADAVKNYALNVYSPSVGIYIESDYYGILSSTTSATGAAIYAKNKYEPSYGGFIVGSNRSALKLTNHFTGLSSTGDDGLLAIALDATGTGIIAGGNGTTIISTDPDGSGGAFSGYHGLFSRAKNSSVGIGLIGIGNNGSNYTSTANGSGGALTGYHGLISKSTNATYGTGVIGIGNNGNYVLFDDGSGHQGSGGAFTGNYCGTASYATVSHDNSVGVYGVYNGGVTSDKDGKGVMGVAIADASSGYGVYGEGNKFGVYANGDLGASGTKPFVIDHPMDPKNKILKHYAIESNEVLNLYRGVVVLDKEGNATVKLPDYFTTINKNFSYTLTPIGQKATGLFIQEEISKEGKFKISGGNPNQRISWVVYAERNDPYMQKYRDREVDVVEKDDNQKGKYIMPGLYNQPAEKGIFYINPNGQEVIAKLKKINESKVTKISEKDIIK